MSLIFLLTLVLNYLLFDINNVTFPFCVFAFLFVITLVYYLVILRVSICCLGVCMG